MYSYVGYLLSISALGIYLHAIFITITLGFPLAIASLLYAYERTKREYLMRAVRVLTYVLAVNFALGAVTGTLVEFGLVQIWPGTILAIASFVFAPLALELIAFANEIAFLILFIVTLGRIKTSLSIVILLIYWVFAMFSGLLITSVNSWLVAPFGVGSIPSALYPFLPDYGPLYADPQKLVALKILLISTGKTLQDLIQTPGVSEVVGVILKNPLVALVNPYALVSVLHNLVAAVIIGLSIALLGYSYRLYRSGSDAYRHVIKAFYPILLILILLQPTVLGHLMGESVVEYNPVKFAMMEGAYNTYHNPLIALLAYGDPSHPIVGFDNFYSSCERLGNATLGDLALSMGLTREALVDLSKSLRVDVDPSRLNETLSLKLADICKNDLDKARAKVEIVHIAYYTKISGGVVAFIASIALAGLLYNVPVLTSLSRRVMFLITGGDERKSILILSILVSLGVALASVLGWFVREVGRKPWTVYGLLYPEEVVTAVDYAYTPQFAALAAVVFLAVSLGGLYAMYLVASREARFTELIERFFRKR
ncbi:MAG: cytochrome ubiquinol oxidase subunit I [Sulfolobales archaeon]